MDKSIGKYSWEVWLSWLVLDGFLVFVSFFIERTDHFPLLLGYGVAFAAYLYLFSKKIEDTFLLGLIPRVVLAFSIPVLSDDYFRFLWDGTVLREGISPFFSLPSDLTGKLAVLDPDNIGFHKVLLEGMNSRNYYSVYPPVNQWMFYLASLFSSVYPGLVTLKLLILAGEIGVYYVLKKLLNRFRVSPSRLSLYWLNPLVIIELCGNGHFEGVMLFFFLMSAYYFAKMKDQEATLYFAFSVLSKLFSLMFLPLLLFKMRLKRVVKAGLLLGLVVLFCFLPFFKGANFVNFLTSIDLYFQSFEFNSGLFYLVRYIGFETVGYDVIQTAGPILGIISFTLILLVSFLYRFRNRLSMFTGFLLINSIYLLFSPIVHPWYIVMLLGLSVLTNFKFPMVWTLMVFVSYTAYQVGAVKENMLLVAIEYLLVLLFLILDLKKSFSWKKLKAGLSLT